MAIIPQPPPLQQSKTWQQALGDMITCPLTLLKALNLEPKNLPWQWDPDFPLRVSKSFVQRMRPEDPHDPLLRQVLSVKAESHLLDNFSRDPLKETQFNPVPGLLHKFPRSVLLTLTSSCAIHCRYCFRRHFSYQDNNPGKKGWQQAFTYIQQHPEIMEVILSGGDPLMAQDEMIASFLKTLRELTQIQILRFHTRLPVVIPERICTSLLEALSPPFEKIFVYHINHPNEIIPEIANGVAKLKEHGVTVLNQSVLLKGVNDNSHTLKQLSLGLFSAGILPYYINLLDPVQGASHFSVENDKAKLLQQGLRDSLPGYLVPKFVQEIPHRSCKTPLDLIPC